MYRDMAVCIHGVFLNHCPGGNLVARTPHYRCIGVRKRLGEWWNLGVPYIGGVDEMVFSHDICLIN